MRSGWRAILGLVAALLVVCAVATACSSESGFGGIEGSAHTSPPDGLPGPTAVPTTPQVTEATASTATRPPAATLAPTPAMTTPATTTPATTTRATTVTFPRLADELEDYFGVEFEYDDYLCREAYSGGWDDYDCVRYDGGDPPSFYSPDLYCTDSYGSLECDPDHYPSEGDGSGDDWDDWEGEFEDERDECWEDYWESEWEDECW